MKTELRRSVTIKPGGLIELRDPELPEGETAEVVVRVGSPAERVREARELFAATQGVPASRTITEDEIGAEIRAWRRSRR
jgi:hypothetical protein